MKNVYIVDGHQTWEHSKGQLNSSLTEHGKKILLEQGCNVKTTNVESDWNNEQEVENFKWADVIIFQFPIFWFNVPWRLKKYIDEVYMAGNGIFFKNDGRTEEDPAHNYGKGGLLTNKKYMICTTWNAPLNAFEEKGEFFEQKDVDSVMLCMHKPHQFCGMKSLKSFHCYDVIKNPKPEGYFKDFENHLIEQIVKA